MAPLQHARATVIKLHGDYLDVEAMRNTPAELVAYDPAMQNLLARILDEYGLIILGWSGEWDTALVHAIENAPSRRYPAYWAAYRGQISPAGRRLLDNRAGHLISITGADSFCTGIRDKVNALARMADPPPTRAVAIATLKQNLRPSQRIELFDQVSTATARTIDRLTAERYPVHINATTNDEAVAELERQLADYDTDTDVLAALTATAIFHGNPDTDAVILRAARRMAERPRLTGAYHEALGAARRYPALRIATCAGVAAVAAGRDDFLVPLLVGTTSSTLENSDDDVPLVWCLHPWRVLEARAVTRMPQYQPKQSAEVARQPVPPGKLPRRARRRHRRERVHQGLRPLRVPPGHAGDPLRSLAWKAGSTGGTRPLAGQESGCSRFERDRRSVALGGRRRF